MSENLKVETALNGASAKVEEYSANTPHQEMWNKVCLALKSQMDIDTFDLWLKPVTAILACHVSPFSLMQKKRFRPQTQNPDWDS